MKKLATACVLFTALFVSSNSQANTITENIELDVTTLASDVIEQFVISQKQQLQQWVHNSLTFEASKVKADAKTQPMPERSEEQTSKAPEGKRHDL